MVAQTTLDGASAIDTCFSQESRERLEDEASRLCTEWAKIKAPVGDVAILQALLDTPDLTKVTALDSPRSLTGAQDQLKQSLAWLVGMTASLSAAAVAALPKLRQKRLDELVSDVMEFHTSHPKASNRGPVVLVLSKDVQHLPWESIPTLQDQTVTRVPSLPLLSALLRRHSDAGRMAEFSTEQTFYVVDPTNQLQGTRQRFQAHADAHQSWHGVIGSSPDPASLKGALEVCPC